jgi:HNH endonuclease
MSRLSVDKEIAKKVLARAKGYCEVCGQSVLHPNLHHRKLKSQGGKDEVSNLIAVHNYCHAISSKSIHMNPKNSMLKGYIVPSYATPSEYPLHLPNGDIVRLAETGEYIKLEGEGNGRNQSSGQSW